MLLTKLSTIVRYQVIRLRPDPAPDAPSSPDYVPDGTEEGLEEGDEDEMEDEADFEGLYIIYFYENEKIIFFCLFLFVRFMSF